MLVYTCWKVSWSLFGSPKHKLGSLCYFIWRIYLTIFYKTFHDNPRSSDGPTAMDSAPIDLVGANENVSNTVDIETTDQSGAPGTSASGLAVVRWASHVLLSLSNWLTFKLTEIHWKTWSSIFGLLLLLVQLSVVYGFYVLTIVILFFIALLLYFVVQIRFCGFIVCDCFWIYMI